MSFIVVGINPTSVTAVSDLRRLPDELLHCIVNFLTFDTVLTLRLVSLDFSQLVLTESALWSPQVRRLQLIVLSLRLRLRYTDVTSPEECWKVVTGIVDLKFRQLRPTQKELQRIELKRKWLKDADVKRVARNEAFLEFRRGHCSDSEKYHFLSCPADCLGNDLGRIRQSTAGGRAGTTEENKVESQLKDSLLFEADDTVFYVNVTNARVSIRASIWRPAGPLDGSPVVPTAYRVPVYGQQQLLTDVYMMADFSATFFAQKEGITGGKKRFLDESEQRARMFSVGGSVVFPDLQLGQIEDVGDVALDNESESAVCRPGAWLTLFVEGISDEVVEQVDFRAAVVDFLKTQQIHVDTIG